MYTVGEREREKLEGKREIKKEGEKLVKVSGRWGERGRGRRRKLIGGEGWYQVCSKDRQTDMLGGR